MAPAALIKKKAAYFEKLINLIQTIPDMLIVHADFVGSKQLQQIRIQLRGKAIVLMGKNTMIRTALRQKKDEFPDLGLEKLCEAVKGNIGFIFCIAPIAEIRDVMANNRMPSAAKAGAISQCDIDLVVGPTGLDPSNTNFFQALNIATKIVKGQIELTQDCKVLKEGTVVNLSQQVLLLKLGIKPFMYGLELRAVYQGGAVFDAAVLDITDAILSQKFAAGCANLAALSREVGIPTAVSLPHAMFGAFRNIASLCADIDYEFESIATLKAFFKDPSAFASAGPAAGAAAGGGGAAKPAAAAAVVEEEEEEDMDFDLFG